MQEEKRAYGFSDAVLRRFAEKLKDNITRDAQQFAARGVTAATLTSFQQKIDALMNTSTDKEWLGKVAKATANKDKARETLEKKIRKIRGVAETTFKKDASYDSFDFTEMSNLSEAQLEEMALRVYRISGELEAEMQPEGLTPAMRAELEAARADLNDKARLQELAIENRDNATQQRIATGNILFAQVSELSTKGKAIFLDEDEARYNDYLLPLNSPGGGEEEDDDEEPGEGTGEPPATT